MAKSNGKRCTCNVWLTLLGLIFVAIGLFFLVEGFRQQFNGEGTFLVIGGWYFIGLVVVLLGKICKWKGHMSCPVHSLK